jgi:hypothetical protein
MNEFENVLGIVEIELENQFDAFERIDVNSYV